MAKLNTKHANGELMMFSDFTGGLNLSKPPEAISDNELQTAVNFEFAPDTGMLKTRGGLTPIKTFATDVDDIIPISGDVLFIKRGRYVDRYNMADGVIENTWDLGTGEAYDKPAAYDFWGDSFQVVMAFGGHLWWSTEGGGLEAIEGIGFEWTPVIVPTGEGSSQHESVAYGNGLFVTVVSSYWLTSPDGINWTVRTFANGTGGSNSICFGGGLFVSVGPNWTIVSPDGINWTNYTASDLQGYNAVCYGNGRFVAIGGSGATQNNSMTSTDGSNWTLGPGMPTAGGTWDLVGYGNGLFVATHGGSNPDTLIITSPDGLNWTPRHVEGMSASSIYPNGIAYGNGIFVILCSDGTTITSRNGIDWAIGEKIESNSWRDIVFGDGMFLAIGSRSTTDWNTGETKYFGKYAVTTNGVNWSIGEAPGGIWRGITYGGGRFVAVQRIAYENNTFISSASWGAMPERVEQLFIRGGRVFLIETDSDTLKASGVGDLANWKHDTDADSISIDIGYKDGCDMRAVVEFAGELISFKAPPGRPEWGRVYRLQGNYPDWNVQLYSKGNSTWNPRSVVTIPNDVLFLSKGGMMSLGTVTEYGDFKIGWAGSKVNAVLAPTLSENCRMWHLPSKGQAWVSDGISNDIWVYHYQIQAWTKFTFGETVKAAFDDGKRTYIGMGNSLYVMSDETPCETPAALKLRTNVKRGQSLIKGIVVGYESETSTEAKLKLGGYELALPHGGQLPDDDPNTGITRVRCNIRDWQTIPEINVTDGAFSLVSLGLEVAEV